MNERYPGMREFATKMFQTVPRKNHGELSRVLKGYLEVAKNMGIATKLNWAEENMVSLPKKLGLPPIEDSIASSSPPSRANASSYTSNSNSNSNSNLNPPTQASVSHSKGPGSKTKGSAPKAKAPPGLKIKGSAHKSKGSASAANPGQEKSIRHSEDSHDFTNISAGTVEKGAVGLMGMPSASPLRSALAPHVDETKLNPVSMFPAKIDAPFNPPAASINGDDANPMPHLTFKRKPASSELTSPPPEKEPLKRTHPSDNATNDHPPQKKLSKQEARKARFSNENTPNNVTASPYVDMQIRDVIVGTCRDLEKPYFRLTGQVNPAVVRPPGVLGSALTFVLNKYEQSGSYQYISSQLQSIRQDLTVQHLTGPLTVKVYETNARIALKHDDMGEFNKCLTRLLDLYGNKKQQENPEFMAYHIYYLLYLRKWSELSVLIDKYSQRDHHDFAEGLPGAIHTREMGEYPEDSNSKTDLLGRALACVHFYLRDGLISAIPYTNRIWPLEHKLFGPIAERAMARGVEGILLATYQQNQVIELRDLNIMLGVHESEDLDHGNSLWDLLQRWDVPLETPNTIRSQTALPAIQRVAARLDGRIDIKGQI